MAFTHASAPIGPQTGTLLSADNSIPERHIVIETLRNAAPLLGLSATVISTLDAMLSCLAPKRNHHTVFASNATLTFRRNGISDRTLRRHAAVLQEIGLLVRNDSPNGKRYTKHKGPEGKALRFGFDLSPLFSRLHEIAAMAAEMLKEKEQINYLRTKIRTMANQQLQANPEDPIALTTLRLLRRKLSLTDCETLLSQLPVAEIDAEACDDQVSDPAVMTGNDGHFVRHHHKSNKEYIDKENKNSDKVHSKSVENEPISLKEIVIACPEATQYSLRKIETMHDVVSLGRTLAPMIGISNLNYDAAQERLGALRTAATIMAIMQFHEKIASVGAYFRSITIGTKSADYSPERLIRRLAKTQGLAS